MANHSVFFVSILLSNLVGTAFGADTSRSAVQTPMNKTHVSASGYNYEPTNVGKASKALKILILGGPGFTGPYQVKYALARGHTVTVFNRGKTHPGELPAGVEQLIGDRNGQLDALKGRKWDVVIDNPTTLPVWVRDAAEILKGNVDRYVFISTTSVYSDNTKPGSDETTPLLKYEGADAMKETSETLRKSNFALYG